MLLNAILKSYYIQFTSQIKFSSTIIESNKSNLMQLLRTCLHVGGIFTKSKTTTVVCKFVYVIKLRFSLLIGANGLLKFK